MQSITLERDHLGDIAIVPKINNKIHGKLKIINKQGITILESEFKNDIRNGYYLEYWPNGQLKTKSFYKNDKKEGNHEMFWDNGNKMCLGNFIKDLKQGKYTEFWPDGKKAFRGYYKDDILIKPSIFYPENE